ncbi:hypothetical protein M440DRAFT_1402040 [Trichoderma longibrachiatum ATCC 18648]|uniref:Uncharacterized protein n=1 Tax=Trichoderma longibrachiatum ATCC 18648 TaxID=983965 RepID=A0A2T4C1T2_TRILO|nr:hypothetical protein M440DRAFT_1402040 [Trichoderma longibrachiatum ATCC 18648]
MRLCMRWHLKTIVMVEALLRDLMGKKKKEEEEEEEAGEREGGRRRKEKMAQEA